MVQRTAKGTIFHNINAIQLSVEYDVFVFLGMFMLWWGWLGFNCGSTFGVSGGKWKLASRSAVCTLNASCGGGVFVTIYSYMLFNR